MSAATQPVQGEPRPVYGREAYIPEWAPILSDTDLLVEVKDGGVPLGFKLVDVLPERRWAVQKNGELMDRRDFEELYRRFASRVVRVPTGGGAAQVVDIRVTNRHFDPVLIPVPTVRAFVSVAHDFQGKDIRIGDEPNRAVTAKESEIQMPVVPQSGMERLAKLTTLQELKARGTLSDEQFSGEVSRLLSEPETAPPPGPPAGFTVVAKPEADGIAERTARCGKVCGSMAGKAAHERSDCPRCNPPPMEAA